MDKIRSTINPKFAMDSNKYLVNLLLQDSLLGRVSGGVTFTRASDQWCQGDAGVWQKFPANVPAFNSKGILLEPASTNKCTCYGVPNTAIGTQSYHNGATFIQNHTNMTLSGDVAATLTTVDDTAALVAAGLGNIAVSGKVYEVVNPGATTALVDIEGLTNASAHSISIFGRRLAGVDASNYFIALTDSAGIAPLNSSTYVRVQFESTPINHANQKLRIRVPAGNTCRFILPQLEELPFCTSPIVTQGAALVRQMPSFTFPAAGNIPSNDYTLAAEFNFASLPVGTSGNVLTAQDATGQRFDVRAQNTGVYVQKVLTGPVYQATAWSAAVAGVAKKFAVTVSSTGGVRFFGGGVGVAPMNSLTSLVLTGSVTVATVVACVYLKNLRIYRRPLSDAQLMAMTT